MRTPAQKLRDSKRTAKYYMTEQSEANLRKCLEAKLRDIRKLAKDKGYAACTSSINELLITFTGTCQCCGKVVGPDQIRLDHCHVTGVFRGWICHGCNMVLGYVDKDSKLLTSIAVYLERSGIISFTPDEYEVVGKSIASIRFENDHQELTQAEALVLICDQWSKHAASTAAG